jgi:hypothetical protein
MNAGAGKHNNICNTNNENDDVKYKNGLFKQYYLGRNNTNDAMGSNDNNDNGDFCRSSNYDQQYHSNGIDGTAPASVRIPEVIGLTNTNGTA